MINLAVGTGVDTMFAASSLHPYKGRSAFCIVPFPFSARIESTELTSLKQNIFIEYPPRAWHSCWPWNTSVNEKDKGPAPVG